MFVVHCQDKPGAAQVRLDNRAAHLDYLKANLARVAMAGPVQTDDRQGMVGSVLVLETLLRNIAKMGRELVEAHARLHQGEVAELATDPPAPPKARISPHASASIGITDRRD